MLAAVPQYVFCTDSLRRDQRLHPLAPVGIGNADHSYVVDAWENGDDGLHLGGVDRHAASVDKTGLPAGEEEIPVLIHPPQVASDKRGTLDNPLPRPRAQACSRQRGPANDDLTDPARAKPPSA